MTNTCEYCGAIYTDEQEYCRSCEEAYYARQCDMIEDQMIEDCSLNTMAERGLDF